MIIQKQVIDKSGIPLLKRLLHVVAGSQKVTADNIAHVSTPGYKSKSIDFHKEMAAALKKEKVNLQTTNPNHIPSPEKPKGIKTIINDDENDQSGVNNVDIDKEMATLAENQILFAYGARAAMQKFTTLKNVIRGRS